ncbi:MAG: [FeFe] hydrogenase, group A [Clostridia bacterium]|jgi:NADH-quinone oxidoreductase subunit G|nr:[FeFe] hydrogenase, group A [Clostridia bacterium]MCI2000809.1 [FeFe] hydrogenase, group A [Clostridia bacterium]MCI2015399.1 [FeFe] hydrogenase, group A [Clostridia bacterium]
MVKLTIDNIPVEVPENTTILDAARMNGVDIPSLCYLKDINEIAACRVCIVEVEGVDQLVSSCNNHVKEGMVIHTNSPKVREARKVNVELILSQHNVNCAACIRGGNCTLQKIANDLGIIDVPYKKIIPNRLWSHRAILKRDASKCIKCMRCVQICDKVQTLGVWDIEGTGARTTVDISHNRRIMDSDCALCGQCVTHCPVGALYVRDDTDEFFNALADSEKVVVAQVAPAVRNAWGEAFGLKPEEATAGRIVAALKRIGVDYVFDTDFSADLTIMEEGNELLERLGKGENYPMFTSCCPGWVRFMKSQYPDMVDCLSTSKSPQQMFGAVIKTHYAKLMGIDPKKIYLVSIMPCMAKKKEATLPTMNDAETGRDVDLVLTTREFIRVVKEEHIVVDKLKELPFDDPIGVSTGAGVIFGTTGGVMEAALRTASAVVEGHNPEPDAFKSIRGCEGIREAEFKIGNTVLNVAAASGLGNARKLIEDVRSGRKHYDFVEIMACPGGCSGGGGQPIKDGSELAYERSKALYNIDKTAHIRFSHENPLIKKLYDDFLDKPLSPIAEKLLHTDHNGWDMPLASELFEKE